MYYFNGLPIEMSVRPRNTLEGTYMWGIYVGRGGALVEAMTFNRGVVGSTPALAAT